ncbi:hypothetical protein G7Y89_g14463 [Cudoniella acicularis]|uniref:Major facilitator superfamily (MFS) profile domain-containing protein n=1 Tax=Cudoniella acicularis TaxID=354080 RepID=A0A8H4R495_9HELO|nr:hypothetical protein G7Y89_g14463 [Cudoniella acicularis]
MGLVLSVILIRKHKRRKNQNKKCAHHQQPALAVEPQVESDGDVEAKISPANVVDDNEITIEPGNQPPEAKNEDGICSICQEEQLAATAARRYRIRLIAGLFFPFALQALDVTIIASALPWIASDFNEVSQMNWIISAFNLASATFIPFWGQMADIFGRTAALETVLFLMIIGSALCTSAPLNAFPMLIFGRALQGMAAAGISVIIKAILADKVSLKENAKNTSIFSFFAGLSYGIGPVIGSFLTDSNWRWCFGINLPVAFTAIILVFIILRPELLGPQPLPGITEGNNANGDTPRMQRFKARMSMIDFGGQFLFLAGMGLVILALTWGGASYAWDNVHIIAPIVLGGILVIGFMYWEYLMAPGRYLARKFPLQRPTIPWALLSQRNMAFLFYIDVAAGLAMTAVLYFVDTYFVWVEGYTASKAGIQLLYYTPGIGIGVYFAMFFCNIWPRQTFTPLFLGSLIEALGITILTWALYHGHIPTIYGMMGLTGAGTGLRFMPGSLHGIGFFPNNIASVLSLTSFAIPFGSAIGMTIMDTVLNNKLASGFSSLPSFTNSTSTSTNSTTSTSTTNSLLASIDALPPQSQDLVRSKVSDAIVWSFIAILPLMWLAVLASAGLGNVNITKVRELDKDGKVDYKDNITEGVFVYEVLRRRLHGENGKEVVKNGDAREKEKEGVVVENNVDV